MDNSQNSQNEAFSEEKNLDGVQPFFCNDVVEYLLKRLKDRHYGNRVERNNLVFQVIKLKNPISKYELAKIVGLSYPTVKQLVKELEFCGLVEINISMGDNGLPVKMIRIPKFTEEDADKELKKILGEENENN